MTRSTSGVRRSFALALIGSLSVGCAAIARRPWPMMQVVPPGATEPAIPPGDARLTFFVEDERSLGFGDPADAFYVLDGSGHLVGALRWGSAVSVDLPAGEQAFFEWDPFVPNAFASPIDAAMKATLTAGRSYWVRLTTRPRPFYQSAVIPHFVQVNPPPTALLESLTRLRTEPRATSEGEARHASELSTLVAAGREKLDKGGFAVIR